MAVLAAEPDAAAGRAPRRPLSAASPADRPRARSDAVGAPPARRGARRPRARPSAAQNPFIFQLPATSGFRSAIFYSPNRRRAGAGEWLRRPRPVLYTSSSTITPGTPMLQAHPHQSGLDCRQDFCFGLPDHLVRVLGDLYPVRLLPRATRPDTVIATVGDDSNPRRTICSGCCSRRWSGCAPSSAARSDQQQIKQLGGPRQPCWPS